MKLFHWDCSEVLKNYASGDIIVMAEDVAQARQIALVEFNKWARRDDSKFGWMFYVPEELWNDDDREEWQSILDKFSADISKEPLDTQVALFIRGSE